jgi:unsaturated rhamnogalacturonyl hydrolase
MLKIDVQLSAEYSALRGCCPIRWAMGALVAAIQNGTHDPHRSKYVELFKLHAAKLASIHSVDARGIYWHSSLLDPLGFPTPEMTATASFVYGERAFSL